MECGLSNDLFQERSHQLCHDFPVCSDSVEHLPGPFTQVELSSSTYCLCLLLLLRSIVLFRKCLPRSDCCCVSSANSLHLGEDQMRVPFPGVLYRIDMPDVPTKLIDEIYVS